MAPPHTMAEALSHTRKRTVPDDDDDGCFRRAKRRRHAEALEEETDDDFEDTSEAESEDSILSDEELEDVIQEYEGLTSEAESEDSVLSDEELEDVIQEYENPSELRRLLRSGRTELPSDFWDRVEEVREAYRKDEEEFEDMCREE